MVCALVSGLNSSIRVLALAEDMVLCSLYIQVCKWIPTNLMMGVTLQWTSIPSRGE